MGFDIAPKDAKGEYVEFCHFGVFIIWKLQVFLQALISANTGKTRKVWRLRKEVTMWVCTAWETRCERERALWFHWPRLVICSTRGENQKFQQVPQFHSSWIFQFPTPPRGQHNTFHVCIVWFTVFVPKTKGQSQMRKFLFFPHVKESAALEMSYSTHRRKKSIFKKWGVRIK